jgi:hypothetical protein
MGYSRATRRQLIALDLIEGVVDAERASNPSNVRIDQILRRIVAIRDRIRGRLALLNRDGGIVFESRREYNRYRTELERVRDAILAQWPDEELDGREYVNAVLVYADGLAQRPHRVSTEWFEMVGQLQLLYEEMDPGLQEEGRMDKGERAAAVLREAMEEV